MYTSPPTAWTERDGHHRDCRCFGHGTSAAIGLDVSRPFLLHLLFALFPLVALTLVDAPLPHAVFGALLFVSVFTLVHDAMHRSLGLPRWANELILSIGGALIGVSGTAARTMHVVHHARPGAPDDFEGQTLHLSLGRALFVSPRSYFELPVRALRRSRPEVHRRQLVEWGVVLALFTAGIAGGGAMRAYAVVGFVAQITIQVWASYLPHRASAELVSLAKSLAWTRAPLVVSFAFHDLHHRRPSLSCFALADSVS